MRAQQLSGLYDTALATSGVLDPATLLRRVLERVHNLLAPDALGVASLTRSATKLSWRWRSRPASPWKK